VANRRQQRAVDATSIKTHAPQVPRLVLLVEDDELIRVTTAEMLRELGHTVHDAADGEQALALLDRHPVELLLTDLHLPRISGRVLANEARARHPDIAIIIATGDEDVDGLPPGVRVMRKPYDSATLAAAVQATATNEDA
jgi:CheY-like chemotaxis protein